MVNFIVNKTARTGKGEKLWKKFTKELNKRDVEYKCYYTEYEFHAMEIAGKISAQAKTEKELSFIVVVGGDGTMNEVINGIEDFENVVLGMIPFGSGNDFCRGLGIEKNPYRNLEKIIKAEKGDSSHISSVDLGQVEYEGGEKPRLFGISSGVGMDAIVCKRALTSRLKKILNKMRLGKLTYLLLTVDTLFSMDTGDVSVKYVYGSDKDEAPENGIISKTVKYKKLIFSAVMNLKAEGGGVPMAPSANPYDGVLADTSAYGIPKWRTFFCLPVLVAAKHERLKGFNVENAPVIEMNISKPFVLHADGEYLGEVTWAKFTSLPKKLKVVI